MTREKMDPLYRRYLLTDSKGNVREKMNAYLQADGNIQTGFVIRNEKDDGKKRGREESISCNPFRTIKGRNIKCKVVIERAISKEDLLEDPSIPLFTDYDLGTFHDVTTTGIDRADMDGYQTSFYYPDGSVMACWISGARRPSRGYKDLRTLRCSVHDPTEPLDSWVPEVLKEHQEHAP